MKKNSQIVRRLLISTLVLGGLVVAGTTSASAAETASSTAETTSSQASSTSQSDQPAMSSATANSTSSDTGSTSANSTDNESANKSSITASSDTQDDQVTGNDSNSDDQQSVGTALTTATKVTSTITDTAGNALPKDAQNQLNNNLNQVQVSDKGKYSLADVMPDNLTTAGAKYQLSGVTITTTATTQQHTYQITYNADGTANITLSDLGDPTADQTITNVSKADVDLLLANGQLTGYGQPGTALQIAYLYTLLATTTNPTTPTNTGNQTGIVDDSPVASRTQVDATSTTASVVDDTVLPETSTKGSQSTTTGTTTDKDNDTVTAGTDTTQQSTKTTGASAITNHRSAVLVSTPMTTTRGNVATTKNIVTTNNETNTATTKSTLPQTGDHETAIVSGLGVVLLMLTGGLGFSVKKRREN